MFLLSLYKIIYLLTAITGFVLSVVVFRNSKGDRFSFFYGLVNVAVFVWALGRYMSLLANTEAEALLAVRVLYFGSVLIYVFFLHTILIFLNLEKKRSYLLTIFYANAAILLAINTSDIFLGKNLFIADVVPKLFFPYYEVVGKAYILQLIANLFIPIYTFTELFICYREGIFEENKRQQLKYILISSIFGFIGGGTILLLVYDIPIQPFGLPLVALQFITIAYAIARFRLFNLKVIAAQLFVLALWAFIFARAYLSTTTEDRISNWGLLLVTIVFGIFLMRSVRMEVEQREKIEVLAKELSAANERLKDLDRQKSEFVSIASHQLRSPLTAIKGYSSLVLEGSYGPVTDKIKMAVDRIFQSSQSLVVVIENFLNISRIEQGRMKYDFAPVELTVLARQIVDQLLPNGEKKGLKIIFETKVQPPVTVSADADKLRQVILNLVDNAIKYTPTGSITVAVEKSPSGSPKIVISDTGIGMTQETISKLFQKFSRADGASKVNAGGAGLGLFLASEIMKAHHGTVRAESDGVGKGSRFLIEFGA